MDQKTMTTTMREQVSALADGQLDKDAVTRLLEAARRDAEVDRTWQRYHLVGDVLRAGRHERCTDSAAFVAALRQRLASEQPLVAAVVPVARTGPDAAPVRQPVEAANEPAFRWKMLAGVASLAAAVAIGWSWMGGVLSPSTGAQIAQTRDGAPAVLAAASSSPPSVALPPPPDADAAQAMLRDPRLDEMLAAHQQASGGSQMPSAFLRNATFEAPSR